MLRFFASALQPQRGPAGDYKSMKQAGAQSLELATDRHRLLLDNISNDAILGVPHGLFRLTSKDLEQAARGQAGDESKRARISISGLLHIPAALASSYGLGGFQNENQVNPDLPDPATGGQPVYLICKAPSFSSGLFSTKHWSIYSQGHFFHLGTQGPAPDPSESRPPDGGPEPRNARHTVLREQDLSQQSARDALTKGTRPPPLSAYEVSRTDFTPSEIRTIAQWLINRLSIYDLLRNNCQMFVLELMHRTAMTRRQCTTFVGTAPQIAEWDQGPRAAGTAHHSCIAAGFELTTSVRLTSPIPSFLRLINQGAKIRSIRALHDRGPLVVYACDPTGRLSTPRYYLWQWSALARDTAAHLALHYGDMLRNARQARWRNLWSEDVTDRLRFWSAVNREVRRGRWVGERWVICVEGREIALRHPWDKGEEEEEERTAAGEGLPELPGKTFRGFVVEIVPIGEREGTARARPDMTLVSSCMR